MISLRCTARRGTKSGMKIKIESNTVPPLNIDADLKLIICIYTADGGENMAKALTSLRLDDRLVRRAQRAFRAKNRTQTIEMSLEAVVETDKHRKLIKRYSGKARLGDFDRS